MATKKEYLDGLRRALSDGFVTADEVVAAVNQAKPAASATPRITPSETPRRPSAISVMYYAAGVILFAAVVSAILQIDAANFIARIGITSSIGLAMWVLSYFLASGETEVRAGLSGPMMVTGSLLFVASGALVAPELVSTGISNDYAVGLVLLALAVIHFWYYTLNRQRFLLLFGNLLTVLAVWVVAMSLLQTAKATGDVAALATYVVLGLLVGMARLLARIVRDEKSATAFDRLAIVLALLIAFIGTFLGNESLWYLILFAGIATVFWLSLVQKQRILLGTGATFLILSIITISFRYFSEFGVTASLLVSATGVLFVAFAASHLSKKYIG